MRLQTTSEDLPLSSILRLAYAIFIPANRALRRMSFLARVLVNQYQKAKCRKYESKRVPYTLQHFILIYLRILHLLHFYCMLTFNVVGNQPVTYVIVEAITRCFFLMHSLSSSLLTDLALRLDTPSIDVSSQKASAIRACFFSEPRTQHYSIVVLHLRFVIKHNMRTVVLVKMNRLH